MFATSHFGAPVPHRLDTRLSEFGAGEGRLSDDSRVATFALLFPRGRPGPWLLLLAVNCGFVVVQAMLTRLA